MHARPSRSDIGYLGIGSYAPVDMWIRFRTLSLIRLMSLWFLDSTGSVCYLALSLPLLRFSSKREIERVHISVCQDLLYSMYSATMSIVVSCLLFTRLGPDHPGARPAML
jgi:hypothetical protein